MTERVLGDGASTCKDKNCETCSEVRESRATKKTTTSAKAKEGSK